MIDGEYEEGNIFLDDGSDDDVDDVGTNAALTESSHHMTAPELSGHPDSVMTSSSLSYINGTGLPERPANIAITVSAVLRQTGLESHTTVIVNGGFTDMRYLCVADTAELVDLGIDAAEALAITRVRARASHNKCLLTVLLHFRRCGCGRRRLMRSSCSLTGHPCWPGEDLASHAPCDDVLCTGPMTMACTQSQTHCSMQWVLFALHAHRHYCFCCWAGFLSHATGCRLYHGHAGRQTCACVGLVLDTDREALDVNEGC